MALGVNDGDDIDNKYILNERLNLIEDRGLTYKGVIELHRSNTETAFVGYARGTTDTDFFSLGNASDFDPNKFELGNPAKSAKMGFGGMFADSISGIAYTAAEPTLEDRYDIYHDNNGNRYVNVRHYRHDILLKDEWTGRYGVYTEVNVTNSRAANIFNAKWYRWE